MRLNYQLVMFNDSGFKTISSQVDLKTYGTWTFFIRQMKNSHSSYGIWHHTDPLSQFDNPHTRLIFDLLEGDLIDWLDPWSMHPVIVSEKFRVASPFSHTAVWTSTETLRIVFDYAELVGERDRESSSSELPHCHIAWAAEDAEPDLAYPAPNLYTLCTDSHSMQCDALLLLMRCPWEQDGGVEHMFEQYLWPAFRMLFHTPNVVLLPEECGWLATEAHVEHPLPLLFICGSPKLTDDVRTKMAQAIHPTLEQLLRLHGDKEALPQHCFVYGLHLSRKRMTIFVHFPIPKTAEDGSFRWEFVQLFVASYLLSIEWGVGSTFDDVFLWRWRLTIALFTILKHVEILEQDLHVVPICKDLASGGKHFGEGMFPFSHGAKCPCHGRAQSSFAVPSDWKMPNAFDIDTSAFIEDMELTLQYPYQLSSLTFYPIRERLRPIPRSSILENHFSSHFKMPDFLHPLHVPRSIFQVDQEGVVDREVNTRPHFFKARDFLAMTSPRWEDVNIFIANIFAGFSEYAVRWKPVTRYPSVTSSCLFGGCVVDFALAVQTIPPTVSATILRAPRLPLTISSPAVLLGVTSKSLEDIGHSVTANEKKMLKSVMAPHLQLFRRSAYMGFTMSNTEVNPNPTLFCTYVKRDYVHLLSFSHDQPETSRITTRVLESFPLSLDFKSREDLYNRLRIVMALFTLQRQIVKTCEKWGSIYWPVDMLSDEHAEIVDVTGINTPTPSEEGSSCDTDYMAEHWDLDSGSEDDPERLKRQMTRSVQRVSQWLASLEPHEI
ncbi:hypothetical protein NM688_g2593 [Phlebia brevispora]|uniref:Uncharacterized protein n=1 Tax=Phlebia brevispora TaxID=194682 RepID=A0ACC1T899_9APHY|nr:hypothetical protein NM688_g2593 [Phlebia brevispora]